MLLKNGTVYDAVNREPYQADVAVREGVIAAIGPDLQPQAGEEVIDCAGKRLYPGFVDAHSHLGLDNYGMGYEGDDYNEMGDIIAAQLRGIDSFNPQDKAIPMALHGGVTTVGVGPGSANVLGGTFLAVKTWGSCVDDMVVKAEVAMKCAFGENPKRCYRDKGDSARMTTAAKLREMLFKARDYLARKEAAGDDPLKRPAFDMKLEALIPVLKGEMPLESHAHRADDICTAIRVAKEFGVRMTLEHCTEGHLIPDLLAQEGAGVITGPCLTDRSKPELMHQSLETPAILQRFGVKVAICTDHPETPIQYLPLCAAMASRGGMDPESALACVTIRAAELAGVADRVGSLAPGKDADVTVTSAHPLNWLSRMRLVVMDGKVVHGRL